MAAPRNRLLLLDPGHFCTAAFMRVPRSGKLSSARRRRTFDFYNVRLDSRREIGTFPNPRNKRDALLCYYFFFVRFSCVNLCF